MPDNPPFFFSDNRMPDTADFLLFSAIRRTVMFKLKK